MEVGCQEDSNLRSLWVCRPRHCHCATALASFKRFDTDLFIGQKMKMHGRTYSVVIDRVEITTVQDMKWRMYDHQN